MKKRNVINLKKESSLIRNSASPRLRRNIFCEVHIYIMNGAQNIDA